MRIALWGWHPGCGSPRQNNVLGASVLHIGSSGLLHRISLGSAGRFSDAGLRHLGLSGRY